ncbi:MAG: phytoene desaturase family protein [bacterium]
MDTQYDIVIIGAGVAGLVCGCYLAKAGLNVLIVEQSKIAGGYCTTFKRKEYKFDVGVHYVGSCSKNGDVGRVITDLGLDLDFFSFDPIDKIILPNHIIYIRKHPTDTMEEFKKIFANEASNIKRFFDFILKNNILSIYSKTKKLTFSDLLNDFFFDEKIKAALTVLLGNIALPSDKASALTAAILFKKYIFDGGYYPRGGAQSIPDSLSKRFKDYGGKLLLSTKVQKIITINKRVKGIVLNGEKIFSDFIVAAGDATNVFRTLLNIECDELSRIKNLFLSSSCFAVYLGLKQELSEIIEDHCSTWFFSTYDINNCYSNPLKNIIKNGETRYVLCTFPSLHEPAFAPPGKSTMGIFICAPYQNGKNFWDKYTDWITEILINKASNVVPNLHRIIDIKIAATPDTFYKFTLNREGAQYGWASIPQQIGCSIFPQKTSIKGLFVAGHWCTHGAGQGGISVSIYSGKRAAQIILNRKRLFE